MEDKRDIPLSKQALIFVFMVCLACVSLYFLLPYIQLFYQDMKRRDVTYQIGLDIATSLSIIISAAIFTISSFSANKRMEKHRILEERTSMRVQKMFEINSKIGDSIVKIILTFRRPPSDQTDKEIAARLDETSLLLDTFLFNLGAIGTKEQFDILTKAKSDLKDSVKPTSRGGADIDLKKLKGCLLELQEAIMTEARELLTMEDAKTSRETISSLLKNIYSD